MFFKRKKQIVLTCVTANHMAYELFKIKNAKNFIPNWWKDLSPGSIQEHLKSNSENLLPLKNLRRCPGFIQNYMHGVIMPLWSDLIVELGDTNNNFYRWQFADCNSVAAIHGELQRGNYLPANKFSHLKLVSPWLFYCDETTPWISMHPTWNNENPHEYFGLPGIADFKEQHTTNINLFFIREEMQKRVLLPAEQPICHFIPLCDRKIVVKCKLVSQTEFDQNYSSRNIKNFKFFGSYLTNRSIKLKNGES